MRDMLPLGNSARLTPSPSSGSFSKLQTKLPLAYRDRQLCQRPAKADFLVSRNARSAAEMLAQQQPERRLSRAAGLGHGFEENVRAFDRAVSASAVNLPTPWLGRDAAALHGD